MTLENVLAVLGLVGVPAIMALLYRATVNKLQEQFASRKDIAELEKADLRLRADVDEEFARLNTASQVWIADFRRLEKTVDALVADERHNRKTMERLEKNVDDLRADFGEFQLDQSRRLVVLRDEINTSVDRSLRDLLPKIEDIMNRKI